MELNIVLISGIALLVNALVIVPKLWLWRNGTRTTAIVLASKIEDKSPEYSGTVYSAMVELEDTNGNLHTVKIRPGRGAKYLPGEEINILYNPRKPSSCYVSAPYPYWSTSIFIVLVLSLLAMVMIFTEIYDLEAGLSTTF
jgi:hypothetical protein